MRIRRVVSVLVVLPLSLVAGCGADFAVPRTAAECYEAAPDLQGHHLSDGVSGWNVAYAEASRQLGSGLTVYVCGPTDVAATVSIDAPPGVEVDPAELEVTGDPDALGSFEVTVTAKMEDTLHLDFRNEGGGGGTMAITIVTDDDEWSLAPR